MKLILRIKKNLFFARNFGFVFFVKKVFFCLLKMDEKKHLLVLSYLEIFFADLLKTIIENPKKKITKDLPIWICWWQGLDKAPALVKACVESVREHANGRKVIVVSEKNYLRYIGPFSQDVLDKFTKKNFPLAWLSDLLRFSLLSKYGGIWIDSTMLVTKNIPDIINYPFYSLKTVYDGNYKYVPQKKWTTFFIASCEGNEYVELIRKMLLKYISIQREPIDYFLLDYCIKIVYDHFSDFRVNIESLPEHRNLYVLQKHMNDAFSDSLEKDVFQTHQFNKLSWKKKYQKYTFGKQKTCYNHILEKWGVSDEIRICNTSL